MSASTMPAGSPTGKFCRTTARKAPSASWNVRWPGLSAMAAVVERVITDNGNCYRSQRFRQACADHGLRHLRTRPYTPRTNGKAERFIQTSLREWAYVWPYASSQQRSAALIVGLDQYNTARPHTALGGCPPAARLRQLQLLCSSEGTVASSRPAFTTDRSGGPGQGSRKATGNRRRAASLAACRCGYTLPRRDPCLTSSTTFVAMTARDLSSTRRITWLCSNARWTL